MRITRERLEYIINTWKEGIPSRNYAETCSFWDKDGEFNVYKASGNPGEWGNKITRIGPSGALELFSDFHDECETFSYQVFGITIDLETARAAWQVNFRGRRKGENINQELAFMIELNSKGKISKSFIWHGNP